MSLGQCYWYRQKSSSVATSQSILEKIKRHIFIHNVSGVLPVVPVLMDHPSIVFQVEHRMPSTRSQGQAQPTLQFPRRKSCRVSSRAKTPQQERLPAPSPTKPEPQHPALARIGPLSPRRPAAQHSPASPSHVQPRFPLSPRKRTGERLHTGRGHRVQCFPSSEVYVQSNKPQPWWSVWFWQLYY